jgi:hypothetical protein
MLTWGAYEKKLNCVQKIFPCGSAPTFWSINWAAALLHLINTLATLALWATSNDKDQVFKLTENYAPWVANNGTCSPTNVKCTSSFQVSEEWCIETCSDTTSELSLWWLIIVFHFLSFVFQTLAMAEWKIPCCGVSCVRTNYIEEVDKTGTNPLRMIEYSVSATLMQISIALILGVWDRLTIIGVAVLTAVTMISGLIAEQLKYDRKSIAWIAHFNGWLSMIGVWVILGRQFLFTIEKSTEKPPNFVYAIVGVIGILYTGFALVQTIDLALTGAEKSIKRHRAIELSYCVLSLTSKTFLGWIIFGNALSGMATNN